MAVFVNQHQFFIDKSQLMVEEVAEDGETYVSPVKLISQEHQN